jgi:hypothetical protein
MGKTTKKHMRKQCYLFSLVHDAEEGEAVDAEVAQNLS